MIIKKGHGILMSKKSYLYTCYQCGANHPKWAGKCTDCGEWNSIELERQAETHFSTSKKDGEELRVFDVNAQIECKARIKVGIEELDRVLGGGFVEGSVLLVGGDPGIGKSSLLLQVAGKIAETEHCLYVSGEESVDQVQLHASRLGLKNSNLKILAHTNIVDIIATIKKSDNALKLVVIDSIQTMFVNDIPSAPGTVTQVRSSAHELITCAKTTNTIILIVGHVTKDGQIAGPRVLEHMVDAVLYFEGERSNSFRILRSVKNRFGNTNEIGLFEMQDSGLKEVTNPSSLFLTERKNNVAGSVIFACVEGTRPILVEVQALVAKSYITMPRRAVVGWDMNRLAMILAVLSTRYGVNLSTHEVYLNIVGGLKIAEPALDLAVLCALISAFENTPLPPETVIFGEVGLSGEVRKVSHLEERLKEAAKLGCKSVILPSYPQIKNTHGLDLQEISHIKQLKSVFNASVVMAD